MAEQIIARAAERDLLGVAAQLDAVEGAQVDGRGQVGLQAVHDEEPVQRGRGGRVDLVHRRALRRDQLERQRLRAQAVAHVEVVVVGRAVLPQSGPVLGQRRQGGRLGVVPVEGPALLVGGVARDLADVAEVAEVLGARAGDLLGPLLTLPVDLHDDEAEGGEEEHAGREEAAAAVGAAHRRDEHDRAEAAEHRDGVHQHAAGALALLELGRRLQDDLTTGHLRLVEPLTATQCRAHASPSAVPDEVALMIGVLPSGPRPALPLQPEWRHVRMLRGPGATCTRAGRVSDVQQSLDATIAISVHGPAGVLDLVVPAARRGRRRPGVRRAGRRPRDPAAADLPRRAAATPPRRSARPGVQPGDVLVATTGVHRPRQVDPPRGRRRTPREPRARSMIATVAAAVAVARRVVRRSRGRRRRSAPSPSGCCWPAALVATLPLGRHARQRAAAAPAFAAAAAFAALYEPGVHLLPGRPGSRRHRGRRHRRHRPRACRSSDDEVTHRVDRRRPDGLRRAAPSLRCSAWDARVSWTLLVFLSMMAARFAPSLAIDVPDEALLDLDRLAVTAWSARDTSEGGAAAASWSPATPWSAWSHRASRIVTGVGGRDHGGTMLVASPLLLRHGDHRPRPHRRPLPGLLRGLLAAPRRPAPTATPAARILLRLAGLGALVALAVRPRRGGPALATSTCSSTSPSGWA